MVLTRVPRQGKAPSPAGPFAVGARSLGCSEGPMPPRFVHVFRLVKSRAAPIQSQRSRVEGRAASRPGVAVISATVCFLACHEVGRAGPCPSMLMEQSCIVRCITSRRSLQQSMCSIQCTFCMLRGTQSHQPMGGLLFDFACATCPVALASPRTLPVVPCNPRAEPTKTPAAQATPNFPVGAVGQCLVRWRHHAASTDSGSETI